MLAYLPSIVALGSAALIALIRSRRRPSPSENVSERKGAAFALAVTLLVQSVHFVEETLTDFHVRLGATFDLPEMPFSVFVAFNIGWIAVWIISVPGLKSGRRDAFFAAWFLSIAGIINACAHPLLALAAGDYFPGLITSPLIGGCAVWLWIRLESATTSIPAPRA